jgi:hypothetical protein
MRMLLAATLLALAAACSPPAQTEAEAPATEAPAEPAADLGPYTNSWDSDQFSRFNHTLRAATPGRHVLALEARTEGGTETVAVYPADANGERAGGRIVFVVATTGGNRATQEVDVAEAGLPVVVVVENASGRRAAGSYTLTLQPAAP